jgi:GTP-binding protein HflX
MRALSGADVLVEDRLFATLDPVTRRVVPPQGSAFLLTDTVGFIQKLPTQLVAAFRATLEELSEASLLMHVVDITHPDAAEQAQTVEDTLAELGLADKLRITVLNKADVIRGPDGLPIGGLEALGEVRTCLRYWRPDALLVSALKGWGLTDLLGRIEAALGLREEGEAASWGYRVRATG